MASYVDVTPELMTGFLDEAEQFMSQLNANLLNFEADTEQGPIRIDSPEHKEWMNEMFRAAHSLKGLAATMGFDRIKDVTHLMETLFDRIRMGEMDLDSDKCETLFVVFDCLQRLVDELTCETTTSVDTQPVIEMLEKQLNQNNNSSNQANPVAGATDDASAALESESASGPMIDGEVGEMGDPTADILALTDPQLRKLFIDTTTEAIDTLNENLLSLEESATDETLNEIFRMAHNIKGACGAAGLDAAYNYTHDLETVLDKLRTAQIGVDEQLMSALFGAADALREVLDQIRAGQAPNNGRLDRSAFAIWTGTAEAADTESLNSESGAVSEDNGGANNGNIVVTVTFPKAFAEAEIQAYLILNCLKMYGDVIDCKPDIENATGVDMLEEVQYTIDSDGAAEEIREAVSKYQIESVRVDGGESRASESETAAAPATAPVDSVPKPVRSPSSASQEAATQPPVSKPNPTNAAPCKPTPDGSTAAAKVAASAPTPSEPKQPASTQPAAQKPAGQGPVRTGETIRVDIERLDQLMNLGGELVICRARLNQIQNRLTPLFDGRNLRHVSEGIAADLEAIQTRLSEGVSFAGSPQQEELARLASQARSEFEALRAMATALQTSRAAYNDFTEAVHVLGRVSDGLQKGIMDTRMVPVGPLFTRFKRVVRDLAKAKGKRINLELIGEATELDKRMIDELGDPLTHMVRNSVDHGLETPDVRKAAGKPETGTIILEAYHSGNSICIEIGDDGRGVDHEAVRKKAVERQILTQQQADAATPKELVQLIFQPGFSTAKEVSDLSGRGMGMDIVLNKLSALSGSVEVDSTPGEGTRVTIRLPLTLAIINALLVRVGDGMFAIPIESVAEIITARREDIRIVQRRRVVRVRENIVPVVRFAEIFGIAPGKSQREEPEAAEETLCIIGVDDQRIGLSVDHLVGQEDVVIKSLTENYQNVRGFAGASIMGDGQVCLILDVGAVMELVRESPPNGHSPKTEAAAV